MPCVNSCFHCNRFAQHSSSFKNHSYFIYHFIFLGLIGVVLMLVVISLVTRSSLGNSVHTVVSGGVDVPSAAQTNDPEVNAEEEQADASDEADDNLVSGATDGTEDARDIIDELIDEEATQLIEEESAFTPVERINPMQMLQLPVIYE